VAVLDLIILVGLMLQTPSAVDPQGMPPAASTPPPTPSAPRDPSLDRIRARLAEPPAITAPPTRLLFSTSAQGKPLFQVHIQGPQMSPWDWLDDGTTIPAYVHPTYPPTHHEFLLSVTPEMFRGVSVHPYGVPVLSIGRAIAKATRGRIRRFKEARATREVQEALAAFAATTAKPED
jgi:hypothetical protein